MAISTWIVAILLRSRLDVGLIKCSTSSTAVVSAVAAIVIVAPVVSVVLSSAQSTGERRLLRSYSGVRHGGQAQQGNKSTLDLHFERWFLGVRGKKV